MSLIDKILKEAAIKNPPKVKFFYHATDAKGFASISLEGIKGKYGVFLADSPQNAVKFLLLRGYSEIYTFEIPASKLDASQIEESFDHDERFFQCKAWIYNKDIPLEAINYDKTKVFKK